LSTPRRFRRDFLAEGATAITRFLAVLACLPLLIGCSPSATPANATQAATPPPATESPSDLGNAQAILDENDRIIAENQRITAALQDYARLDSVKLDRLTAQCQAKLGADYANGGAKRIYDCIHAAW